MKKTIISGLVIVALTASSNAAVLANYSFAEWNVTGTTPDNINDTYTNLDALKDVNLLSTSIVTAGFNEGGNGSYDNEINVSTWSDGTMTLTLDVGTSILNLDSIDLNIARNGTGAPAAMEINLGATQLATFDSMGIHNGGGGALDSTGFGKSFALSGNAAAQGLTGVVTLVIDREDSDTLNGNLRINDLVVNGTITAVPEPSTTALIGLGGLALILRRRK